MIVHVTPDGPITGRALQWHRPIGHTGIREIARSVSPEGQITVVGAGGRPRVIGGIGVGFIHRTFADHQRTRKGRQRYGCAPGVSSLLEEPGVPDPSSKGKMLLFIGYDVVSKYWKVQSLGDSPDSESASEKLLWKIIRGRAHLHKVGIASTDQVGNQNVEVSRVKPTGARRMRRRRWRSDKGKYLHCWRSRTNSSRRRSGADYWRRLPFWRGFWRSAALATTVPPRPR